MDGEDKIGRVEVRDTSSKKRKYKRCLKVFALFALCVTWLLFGTYLLYNLHTTKQRVNTLEQDVQQLRDLLLHDGSPKYAKAKRSVRARRQGFVDSVIDGHVSRPTANYTTPTSFWRGGQWSRPSTTATPASQSMNAPRQAPSNNSSRAELPAEAYRSDNLVVTPDDEDESHTSAPGVDGNNGFDGQAGAAGDAGNDGVLGGDRAPGAPGAQRFKGQSNTNRQSAAAVGFDGVPGSPGAAGETGNSGSTFIRWGKVSCPQVSTLVYSGYAAAANPWYGMSGSTQLECLSTYPTWHSNSSTNIQTSTKIFAAKFDIGSHTGIFNSTADKSVITCAVCFTRKATVITMPGSVDCPSDWHREYYGYLMATSAVGYQLYFSSRNYCVDKKPDFYTGHNDNNGLKLTFLQAGSCYQNMYPCHSYAENNRMACTVCSKYPDY